MSADEKIKEKLRKHREQAQQAEAQKEPKPERGKK